MRLLLDANLSPRLVSRLADAYPGSAHVLEIGNIAMDDMRIWEFARVGDYLITTKDTDFLDTSLLRGPPPKLVFLGIGNVSTDVVERILRARRADIARFAADPFESCLIVGP